MREIDKDGSGEVDFDEFLEAFIRMRKAELRKKNPQDFVEHKDEDDVVEENGIAKV